MTSIVRILIFILISTSAVSQAETLERCLTNSPQEVKSCVQKSLKNLTLNSCVQITNSIKSHFLSENVRNFCFYEISEFPTFARCLTEAQKFISADRHDDALFECYRQFQYRLSDKQCHELAQILRYPNKAAYLERHCDEIDTEKDR